MKLKQLNQDIMEIWRSPTRIMKRVNNPGMSNNSGRFSSMNSIDPNEYFKSDKLKKSK